jgi:hypothetical protein
MDDRTRSLTLAVNKAGQRELEEPLARGIREARQALAKVTNGKYLGKIYGQCRSWQEAVRVGPILPASKDWLAPLNLPSQAQLVYVAIKGLIETITPSAGATPPFNKAESIKAGARRELLTVAEKLLAADTRKLKILDRKRAEISGLRAETDRAWGTPASSRQRCLFEPG